MSKKKKREKIITIVVLSIAGLSVAITATLLILFLKHIPNKLDTSAPIDPQVFGLFGDVIGGVVGTILAFLSIYLLYLTYRSQKKELRQTQIALNDQKK